MVDQIFSKELIEGMCIIVIDGVNHLPVDGFAIL